MDEVILRNVKSSRCAVIVKRSCNRQKIKIMKNSHIGSTVLRMREKGGFGKLHIPWGMTVDKDSLYNDLVISFPAAPTKAHFYKRHRISHGSSNEKTVSKQEKKKKAAESNVVNWAEIPTEALVHVFSKLSAKDVGRSAQVCRSWHYASQFAELWQHFEFVIGHSNISYIQPTSPGLIEHVITRHAKHLKFVVFKTDTSAQSIQTACRILSKLVNCPLKTLTLVSSNQSRPFDGIDYTSFASALTVVLDQSSHLLQSLAIEATPVDDLSLQALGASSSLQSLQFLQMKGCSRVTPQGILTIAAQCHHLRELTLNWSLLSDALLLALSSEKHTCLEYFRVDVHPCCHYCPHVNSSSSSMQKWKPPSPDSWRALVKHSPGLILVIHFFDQDGTTIMATDGIVAPSSHYQGIYALPHCFFASYIPVTHLYFGDVAPRSILAGVARHCPRLQELVAACVVGVVSEDESVERVGQSGSLLDAELLAMAAGCPQLASVGLGDCEVSCGALVEFAGRLGSRLSRLCVNEDSLVEEGEVDIETTCRLVSRLIGRDWSPEFTPLW